MSDNPLKWNSPFIEIEKNASGYCWRLRLRNHYCIAVSPRDYETMEELKRDVEGVAIAFPEAMKVNALVSYPKATEGKNDIPKM